MIGILINKIISLALIMALGWTMVRCRAMKAAESKSISRLAMFLVMPCVTLVSFQVEYTDEVKQGLLLAFLAAAIIHVLLILLSVILKKTLKLDPVELTSVIYSNAGNLIVPLVGAMLGKEWVIYTSAFSVVQRILLWSHGKAVLCGETEFDFKKIFLNVNMIAVVIGIVTFFAGIRFPALMLDTLDTVGGMIGPLAMLNVGMLIGEQNLRELFTYRRVWLIAALRLAAVPVLVLAFLKFSGITGLIDGGKDVLLVTFLATTTPAATTITQLSQVYGKDAPYASAINVLTTILCIATIPVMVLLYQM